MSVRILAVLCAVLLLSVGVGMAAAGKPSAGQPVCATYGSSYATQAKSSVFTPFSKKQKVLWTCNGYSGGSAASRALVQACTSDGGPAASTLDSGVATCWKNAAV
jgi:hypothetical protein